MDINDTKKRIIEDLSHGKIEKNLFKQDIVNTLSGFTNLDYLEYVRGSLLVQLAAVGKEILNEINYQDILHPKDDRLFEINFKKSAYYLNNIHNIFKISSIRLDEKLYLIDAGRKYLGMCVTLDKMSEMFDLILSNSEIYSKSNPILWIHSGTFNPVTHLGHTETAKHFETYGLSRYGVVSRVVIWTFINSKYKPEHNFSFNNRLSAMSTAFNNCQHISISNYPGSTENKNQALAYQMFSNLSDNVIRYCIGSDAFITRVKRHKEADPTTLAIFNLKNLSFYISLRSNTNPVELNSAIKYATKLSIKTYIVGIQTMNFSGTQYRNLSENSKHEYLEGMWFRLEQMML